MTAHYILSSHYTRRGMESLHLTFLTALIMSDRGKTYNTVNGISHSTSTARHAVHVASCLDTVWSVWVVYIKTCQQSYVSPHFSTTHMCSYYRNVIILYCYSWASLLQCYSCFFNGCTAVDHRILFLAFIAMLKRRDWTGCMWHQLKWTVKPRHVQMHGVSMNTIYQYWDPL